MIVEGVDSYNIIGNHIADIFADASLKGFISRPEVRVESNENNLWNIFNDCVVKYEKVN